jgi:7-cyano-7-deazaguanine reductase
MRLISLSLTLSTISLAPARLSRQQRGMETTPDNPAGGPAFLGKDTPLPTSPEDAVLDYVPNPRPGALFLVRFAAPEFTSLCPVTDQPDFAHLVIDYAPGETIVESKSLKLFLGSFRNHNGFHEDVTVGIGQRLFEEMKPNWLRIGGYWYPRGGIPIDVFWQSGPPPEGLWLPDQGVQPYRGRG